MFTLQTTDMVVTELCFALKNNILNHDDLCAKLMPSC
jgi:hypothetical protein